MEFFATSHGKGPSDGLAGTTKANAARASLQLPPEKQIRNPRMFYEWAKDNLKGINFAFVDVATAETSRNLLKKRFEKAEPIPEITKHHRMEPRVSDALCVQRYSSAAEFRICNLRDAIQPTTQPTLPRYSTR